MESRLLGALEDAERTCTGDEMSGLSWPELAEPTFLQGSRLVDCRTAARAANLLD
jgi:hypothetical protein